MKDGKRKIPVLTKIFILTITLAAVIIPAVIIISSRVSSSREEKFTAAITAVDHARDAETPSRMAGLIRKSGKTAYSAKSWLMVLKRAYEYGKTENDWNLLAELSHDALEDFPGNERIAAAATVASVDSGNSAQAWETARRHLTGDRSRGIRTEAFLLNAFGTDKPALDEMTGGLASIPWSKDPSLFNEAYNMTGDRRFLMDAALLWLKTGNITEAIAYLDRSGSVPGAGYVKGLALYDAGRPEESYPLFLRELEKPAVEDAHRGELHLLAGDAAYRSRDYSDSAFHYRRAVSLAPGISPVPYLNLGRGFSSLPPEPALLERGFSLFPEDRKIAGALALHHIETGAPERAEAVVADFEGAEEGNISLLVLSELTNISNDTRFFVSLQRIHKAFSDNPLVTRYYLWQAVARRDFSRIRQILAESAAEKDTSWHRFYSALWNISRGRTADFPTVSEGMYGWYGSYNAIVLELRQGSVTAAILDKLTKPELYPAVSSRDMADAFALQAELYLKQKAPVVTIKETLEQGLAIDPLNIRIHSLIGSIESPE